MDENIVEILNREAVNIKNSDIDEWVLPRLMTHYQSRINTLAKQAYSTALQTDDGPSVALRAFQEQAKYELKRGVNTFFFVSEHWRSGRDVNTYLLTCLSRLSDRIQNDMTHIKRPSVPVCPGCRLFGIKEILIYQNRLLRCNNCTSECHRIKDELKKESNIDQINFLQERLRLHSIFALHSRKGYRCPECERFIPDSVVDYSVSCIYNDCCFFGTKNELESMNHPLGLSYQYLLSLNEPIKALSDAPNLIMQNLLEANDVNADIQLEVSQRYNQEYLTLTEVINAQIQRLKRNESTGKSVLKLFMYQAFSNMINIATDDMIAYLVHGKHHAEHPIQSRIFQEYVRLIENNLPITVLRNGKLIECCSLIDPNLNLFLGISEYQATVENGFVISNLTPETYTGGRKLKEFGRCFIGYLIDVIDLTTNESIHSEVLNYTFVEISLKNTIALNTPVKVIHFRIPSHYEMMGLVNLQRIRRSIIDSVYFRLNKKKRNLKGRNEKDQECC